MTKSSASQKRFRIQGTDGIRREVRPSSDPSLRGLTPQQAFLEQGVITDEFMERYAYAHVAQVLKGRRSKTRAAFVIGWDPRDIEGLFTEAVIRGVRKAGADAWVLGRVPTPLVPLYMQYAHADGGFMEYDRAAGTLTVSAEALAKLIGKGTIELVGASGASVKGVVQGDCLCTFTGKPHPMISVTVKGSL